MPLIWNDKSLGERLIGESYALIVVFLPIFLLNLIFYYFIMPELVRESFLGTSFISSATIYTFINIFLQFPSSNIPKEGSKYWVTFLYIVHFLVSSLVFIVTLYGFPSYS